MVCSCGAEPISFGSHAFPALCIGSPDDQCQSGQKGIRGARAPSPIPCYSEFTLFAKPLLQSVGHLWNGEQDVANKGFIYTFDEACLDIGLQLRCWVHLPPVSSILRKSVQWGRESA